jgi:glycosyltransferase involved in cell wall biosynthesis
MEKYCRPDIVHISNALLLGLVHRIKERLKVPVICSLQDEDVWMDAMEEKFANRTWELMHQKAMEVDAFISVSRYFAKSMIQRMNLPEEKVYTLHLGVNPDEYDYIPINQKTRNIGYLSRMCHENGFHILIDAFIDLKKNPKFKDVKLIATGGFTGDDASYLKEIRRKLRKANLQHEVEFDEVFEGEGRKDFFRKVSLISVPVLKGEAFGIYLLESMASGIPVVQPPLGAFPEIIEHSKGGIIYHQNTPENLSLSLQHLLSNTDLMEELSLAGRKGVENNFNIHSLAGEMIEIYQKTLSEKKITAPLNE